MWLKKIDQKLGKCLACLFPRPSRGQFDRGRISRVLFIRPGGIGDAVHLVPSLLRIRESFPHAAIDVLAERRNCGVFGLCPEFRRVFCYDQPGELLQVLVKRYDVVIDTEQWHRLSAVVARLARAPLKIGYATNERARLFTHAISYSHDDYEADNFLRLLETIGIAAGQSGAGKWLQVPEAARQAAASLLPGNDRDSLVVIFPGASVAERRWGAERFRRVAQWCLEQGLRVAVVGGAGDRPAAEQIAAGLDLSCLAGRTSLAETAALLEHAAVVVSGDSGVLHLAVGLGRPTVSLFGSGIAAKWAPRGPGHVVLNKGLPCSPCTRFGYTPTCPHEVRCMREITTTEVTRGIASLLDPSGSNG